MEHVAEELTMDPLELKTTNLYHKDQVTHLNQPLPYCNIRSLVPQLMSSANTAERKSQAKAFNQANRWKKRGMSTVPMKYGILWTGAYYNVLISVYNSDGSVAISHGGVEMGQGINTKVMQVCAEKLGIDMSMVTIRPTSDLPSANSQSSGGSTTSEQCALGVQKCCEDLTARMAPVKEHIKDPSWPELVQACFQKGIDLSARYWVYPTTKYPFQYQSYGVTCTEVELDVLTGESQVLRVDILYDCGQSMNPLVDVGQVEGAFVMGLGNWRSEQIKYDPTSGSNLTAGTWEYKPPASQDIPVDFRISLLKDAPNPLGVLRSKAVGEPPQCMACSVLFALKHAIEAARTDLKRDAYFRLDGPATPEVTKAMCLPDISQYVLK